MSAGAASTWLAEPLDGVAWTRNGPPGGQSLAEITHDLRTPLTSLRLLTQGLRDGILDGERRDEYLAQMQRQVSVLTELVDDLHRLSRAQPGPPRSLDVADPHHLLEEAVEAMCIQAEVEGVRLEASVTGCLPVIRADRGQLRRVLLNVIENAIRHAGEPGTVAVRARAALGGVQIDVEDDGDGIPPSEREPIFDAFYGRDGERSPTRSGLGLAIARATLEAHGGRIWVADSTRGARIRLWLPGARPNS